MNNICAMVELGRCYLSVVLDLYSRSLTIFAFENISVVVDILDCLPASTDLIT